MSNSLSKDEWNILDKLLSKHGFGGYYDLVECLKMVLEKIEDGKLQSNWRLNIKDLPTVVQCLLAVTK